MSRLPETCGSGGGTCNLDMDELRTFVAIVDAMSFSRAGDAIGLSQSAVSLRLRRMELSLGVSLLVRRQGRVVELTPAGTTILGYARKIISLNDAALRELAGRPPRGLVRLGVPADFLDIGFPQALAEVRTLLGNFEVEIETDVSQRLKSRCQAGELDIAFYKLVEADGVGKPITALRLDWMGPRDFHAEFRPGAAEPLPLVCFPEGCVYRRAMHDALTRHGIPHRFVFTAPSIESLRKAVAAGMGITALPPTVDDVLSIVPGLPSLCAVFLAMAVAPESDQLVRRVADSLAEVFVVGSTLTRIAASPTACPAEA